jgi:hypothetical protein
MIPFFKIVFSTITFEYHTDITPRELHEIIIRKATKKRTLFSPLQYSVEFNKMANTYNIIRRGYFLPIMIGVTIGSSMNIKLYFKSLINPLFIAAPILLFMRPTLFHTNLNHSNSNEINRFILGLSAILFFVLLSIVFAYIPIKREKRQLEKELKLVSNK